MDDRTRTLAALYILREKRPDLFLLHLIDLDAAEHDHGPFVAGSIATLERTDGRIGLILGALPPDYDLVLASDHGFGDATNGPYLTIPAEKGES
jgi:predicted AlkP superfamily pyrophosphatase or phosphodiesterase